MLIPDNIRKCVVFVGYENQDHEFSLQGTAFFLTRDVEGTTKGFVYLITARHLIKGMAGLEGFDGRILLRVNFTDGNAHTIETRVENWIMHPDEGEVDVAMHGWAAEMLQQLDPQIGTPDVGYLPMALCLNDEIKKRFELGLGDEVFLTGLFHNHHGRNRNVPIVRIGNIVAMSDEEKIHLKDFGFVNAYLIECRSIGGLSGSPVFVRFGPIRFFDGQMQVAGDPYGEYKLLGLMHGHWDAKLLLADGIDLEQNEQQKKEAVNMGIAIVIPVDKILEVVDQPLVREKEIAREREINEQNAAGSSRTGGDDILKQMSQEARQRAKGFAKLRHRLSQPQAEQTQTGQPEVAQDLGVTQSDVLTASKKHEAVAEDPFSDEG